MSVFSIYNYSNLFRTRYLITIQTAKSHIYWFYQSINLILPQIPFTHVLVKLTGYVSWESSKLFFFLVKVNRSASLDDNVVLVTTVPVNFYWALTELPLS